MAHIKNYKNRFGDEVEAIRRFQSGEAGPVHPLTCGNPDCTGGELYPEEVANGVILRCPNCFYIQIVDPELMRAVTMASNDLLFRHGV